MATDRMAELFGSGGGAEPAADPVVIELKESKGDDAFAKFFKEMNQVKKEITSIKDITKQVFNQTQRYQLASRREDEEKIHTEVKNLMKQNRMQCIRTKKTLQDMKAVIDKKPGNPSELRMRSQSYRVVVSSYMEAVKEFQTAQGAFDKETRSQMRRRLRIVNPNMTDTEVDDCIDEGRAQEIFKAVIDKGTTGAVANAYRDVASQNEALKEVAKSMRELRDMMNDFALIVQRQGDQLDTIEGNVDTAQDSVEAGQKHLQKAISYSKKSRKWQCCCLIIALVVIAAILFPILINVGDG